MLTGLALDKLPGVSSRVCVSREWCKGLDQTCRGGGDLAKMITLDVEKRITIDQCYESSTFPVLPDTLPALFARIPTQAPPALALATPKLMGRKPMNAGILAGPYRVEKA
jgi:hypothetical protein